MTSIKTAISIDEGLLARADAVAREMGVLRSEVFARAIEEYLRRRESCSLLGRANAVLEGDGQAEEREIAQRMRRLHRRALDVE